MVNFTDKWDKISPKNFIVGAEFKDIRWHDYPLRQVGEKIPITLQGKLIGWAEVLHIENARMGDLSIFAIHEITKEFLSIDAFFDMMKQWYGAKKDWAGWGSNLNVYYFKVISVVPSYAKEIVRKRR